MALSPRLAAVRQPGWRYAMYHSSGSSRFFRRGDQITVTAHKLRTDSPPLVREQIVEAALNAIEEHGPDALTGQIAKRAGLARPNVYRHFSSKDDLDRAIARSAYQELRAEILTRLDRCGTPLDVIRTPIEAQVVWADHHQNLYRFLVSRSYQRKLQQYVVERSHFASELTAAGTRYFPCLAEDPGAAEATLVGLIGLFDASVLRWLSRPVGTREQLIDRLTAQAWLVIGRHLRELGSHVDPQASLPITPSIGN
jgi:AcrR family transcriptional regulator